MRSQIHLQNRTCSDILCAGHTYIHTYIHFRIWLCFNILCFNILCSHFHGLTSFRPHIHTYIHTYIHESCGVLSLSKDNLCYINKQCFSKSFSVFVTVIPLKTSIWLKIESKAMIRNRYNYPTPPIRDIKGKETQARNNWTLMETSLAESKRTVTFPQSSLSKTKGCKRHTHSKTNYNKNTPWQKNRLGTVRVKNFTCGEGT